MNTPRRLLKYVMVYKARLTLAIACGLFTALCAAFVAKLAGWFTALGKGEPVTDIWLVRYAVEHDIFTVQQAPVAMMWIVAALLILVTIPKGVFMFLNNYLTASITNRIGTDVRGEMYAHIQTWPLRYFHRSRIGDIMSRMSYDVYLIQNSSQLVAKAIESPMMILVGVTGMFYLSWKMAIWTLLFVPPMGVAIDRLARRMRTLTTSTQERLADVSAATEETVRGIRIIKTFGMEGREVKRFDRVNKSSLLAALRAARRMSLVTPALEIMGAVAAALLLVAGGQMVVRDQISLENMMSFTVLIFLVAGAAKDIGRLNVIYQQTTAGADRIFSLLDTTSDVTNATDAVTLKDVEGRVEFRDVRFEYNEGEIVLDGVSFAIEPGEAVAIVGTSGAGKSTIADLIPRFYDVTGGAVLVDGHDVRRVTMESLREQLAMVPQDTILFSGTIADNIAYGRPDADTDKIIDAAKAANAHDFISAMPNGYQTTLGEGGVGLSGGQRQRIAIARALLKDPRILILDEATSSLDAASEGVVQEALERLMEGRSTLVIAHRLSTVTGADKILVLDQGRVVESGSFEQLVTRGGVFAQLYRTQFRPEEASQPANG